MDWRIGREVRCLGGEVRALLGRLAVVFDGGMNYAINHVGLTNMPIVTGQMDGLLWIQT
ncbi:predicted protein [Arabidopsis lyrata subsp. lyrata]|uniref:Predicted protein n=1 Tax=Arabidopsis lyrata subsp. lyrata TaxID=81972 RepID=D7KYR8_ARALL|nr:predicted protein [Arabidopsis lyrata subsp. lyrata]